MRYDGVRGRFRKVPVGDIGRLAACSFWGRALVIYLCKYVDHKGSVAILGPDRIGKSLARLFAAHHKENMALERWAQDAISRGALRVEGDTLKINDFESWQANRQVDLWRRLYSLEDGAFAGLSAAARILSTEFIRKVDHRGEFVRCFHDAPSLARILKARCDDDCDRRLLPQAVRSLVDEGFLVLSPNRAVVRNFDKAQGGTVGEASNERDPGSASAHDADYSRRNHDATTTQPQPNHDATTTQPRPNHDATTTQPRRIHDVTTTQPRRIHDVTIDVSARKPSDRSTDAVSLCSIVEWSKVECSEVEYAPSFEGASRAPEALAYTHEAHRLDFDGLDDSAPPFDAPGATSEALSTGEGQGTLSGPEAEQGAFGFADDPTPKATPKRARKAPSRSGKRAPQDDPPPVDGFAGSIARAIAATQAFKLITPNPNAFANAFAAWSERGVSVPDEIGAMERWLLNPRNKGRSDGWAFAENWCRSALQRTQSDKALDAVRNAARDKRQSFGPPITETRVVDVFAELRKRK